MMGRRQRKGLALIDVDLAAEGLEVGIGLEGDLSGKGGGKRLDRGRGRAPIVPGEARRLARVVVGFDDEAEVVGAGDSYVVGACGRRVLAHGIGWAGGGERRRRRRRRRSAGLGGARRMRGGMAVRAAPSGRGVPHGVAVDRRPVWRSRVVHGLEARIRTEHRGAPG